MAQTTPCLHPLAHWTRFKGIYSDSHFYGNTVDTKAIAAATESLLPALRLPSLRHRRRAMPRCWPVLDANVNAAASSAM